jgi:hypothetical protein
MCPGDELKLAPGTNCFCEPHHRPKIFYLPTQKFARIATATSSVISETSKRRSNDRNIELFSNLKAATLDGLRQQIRTRKLAKGEFLFNPAFPK